MRTKKRLLVIFLALVLALSVLPAAALADEAPGGDSGTAAAGSEDEGSGGDTSSEGEGSGSGTGSEGEGTGTGGEGEGSGGGTGGEGEGSGNGTGGEGEGSSSGTGNEGEGSGSGTGNEGEGSGSGTGGEGEGSGSGTGGEGEGSGSGTGNEGEGSGSGTGSGGEGSGSGTGSGGEGSGSGTGGGNSEAPVTPVTIVLKSATASISVSGRDVTLSWTLQTEPGVNNPLSSTFLHGIQVSLTVGSAAPITPPILTGSHIGTSYTFKDALPTAESAGSGPVKLSAKVTFDPALGETITVGGASYVFSGGQVSASATATHNPSPDPASAVENPCKPLNLSYEPSTGVLSWTITPTYENGVKPGATTKIDQYRNEHFILTVKKGSTVVDREVHFDTRISSTTSSEIKVTRTQNRFSAVYKRLEPGTYTFELLNERSMGSGNLTGTCTVTVLDTSKASTVKAALEKLLNNGFSSSSKAADIRAAILEPVSGTTTAAKLKNLAASLQNGNAASLDLVDLVRQVEQKFLKAVNCSVNRNSASKLGTSIASVTGLGLNSANGNSITISAAAPGKSYDAPSGARASLFFSLSVSGLSDNKNMAFPVQVAMKRPDSFNSTDNVYVLRYAGSGSSEKLDAYLSGSNIVFTTTSFGDFALVQENANGYAVTVASSANGTVTADKKEAAKGSTVTLTVKPEPNCSLAAMVITGKDGKSVSASKQSETQYTFVMPAADVTVQAVFMAVQAPSFTDVPASHTFYKEISWIAQKGLMNGAGNKLFNPGGNVNRQQLWMVLARMDGAKPANMAEARTWAMDNGISDGANPVNAVSRQQLVTMLYRYAEKRNLALGGAAELGAYSDNATVSAYAKDAVAWAVGNGIVSGTTDGRLNPQGTATRAHFAAFLYRFGQKNGM